MKSLKISDAFVRFSVLFSLFFLAAKLYKLAVNSLLALSKLVAHKKKLVLVVPKYCDFVKDFSMDNFFMFKSLNILSCLMTAEPSKSALLNQGER